MNVLVDMTCGSDVVNETHIVSVARFAMSHLDLPSNAEISITFVDDNEMAELNAHFRGKEGPTDVLSFECDNIDDDFPASPDDADGYTLGDIVIAPHVAARQAREYDHPIREEIELLLVHGILHLVGYDHVEDTDAEIMEAVQREILGSWREAEDEAHHE